MTWLAVRCCCQPTKVLGFINVPEFAIDKDRIVLPLKLKPQTDSVPRMLMAVAEVKVRQLSDGETAIYSEDHPIEFWRDVRGFIEAK